jgi:steroid 5-alpha reductase family enzyme
MQSRGKEEKVLGSPLLSSFFSNFVAKKKLDLMLVPATVGSALRLSAGVIAAVNTAGFAVTAATKSHKVTDLTGTAAFVASAWATHAASLASSTPTSSLALLLRPSRGFALACVVSAWGARLSAHLFTRVLRLGKDERLDFLFPGRGDPPLGGPSLFPLKLAGFWAAQGAWAWVCLLPVTVLHGNPAAATGRLGVAGAACAAAALAFVATEAVADSQKNRHYEDASKKGKPCTEGLYSVVRYPNYAAEIGVWTSLALAAATAPGVLASAPLAVAASPLFTYSLLAYGSGIPPLEEAHERKYGTDDEFRRWKREVPRLFPDVFKVLKKE